MEKVVVIAPHPDDETLGCAGTLLKHKKRNDWVSWVIMTGMRKDAGYSSSKITKRVGEIEEIAKIYGFKSVYKLNFPTTKLDTLPMGELIGRLHAVFQKEKPSVLYLPFCNDAHSDHRVTFAAAMGAAKVFRSPFIKKILMYEVASETEFSLTGWAGAFSPDSYSDITPYLSKKIALMKIYKGELGEHPFPRSIDNIKALATCRGSSAGLHYAEAFKIVKEIW